MVLRMPPNEYNGGDRQAVYPFHISAYKSEQGSPIPLGFG